MSNKTCSNCRWLIRTEHNGENDYSYVLYRCGRNYPHIAGGTEDDRRNVPTFAVKVETSTRPNTEHNCFAQVFGCNFWGQKQGVQCNHCSTNGCQNDCPDFKINNEVANKKAIMLLENMTK